MKKYLVKRCMITLMIISFGVINDSHVYAKTIKNEGTFKVKCDETLFYKVKKSGIYKISLTSSGKMYFYNIYGEEKNGKIFKMCGTIENKKRLNVYFEKNKRYVLGVTIPKDYKKKYYKIKSKLVKETDDYKPELTLGFENKKAKNKGYSYDSSTNTLTLNNGVLKSEFSIVPKVVCSSEYVSRDNSLKIVVNGDCYAESLYFEDKYDLEISGNGTLNVYQINAWNLLIKDIEIKNISYITAYSGKLENVKMFAKLNGSVLYKDGFDLGNHEYQYYPLKHDSIMYEFMSWWYGDDGISEGPSNIIFENCELNVNYDLVSKIYLNEDCVIFDEFDGAKFDNCNVNVTINKEFAEKHKEFYKDVIEKGNSKISYNPIDYKKYMMSVKKLCNKNGTIVLKILRPASADGKTNGKVKLINLKKTRKFNSAVYYEKYDTISYLDYYDYDVIKYGKKVLSNIKGLKKAYLGKNVEEIGAYAFSNNKILRYVKIESKRLIKIGTGAFAGSKKKIKFVVPKKMVKKYKKMLKRAKVKKFVVKGF